MTLSGAVKQNYKFRMGAALLLLALPVLSIDGRAVANDNVERGQLFTELAKMELKEEAIFAASGKLNRFIAQYAARSLKGRWKYESRRIASAIIDVGARHGLDPFLLLAVIENESQFDPEVVGTHGEIGLMQIKPDTAEWVAKKNRINWSGSELLRDPVTNIRLGAAYLSMLRNKYPSDKDLYLAAYNMGIKKVDEILSTNTRPQIYPQKTIEHYSRIYTEFVGTKGATQSDPGSYARI